MFPADALTEPAGSTDPVSAPTSTALLGVGLAVAWRRRVVAIAAVGQVVERDYDRDKAWFKVRIPPYLHEEFAPFIIQGLTSDSVE